MLEMLKKVQTIAIACASVLAISGGAVAVYAVNTSTNDVDYIKAVETKALKNFDMSAYTGVTYGAVDAYLEINSGILGLADVLDGTDPDYEYSYSNSFPIYNAEICAQYTEGTDSNQEYELSFDLNGTNIIDATMITAIADEFTFFKVNERYTNLEEAWGRISYANLIKEAADSLGEDYTIEQTTKYSEEDYKAEAESYLNTYLAYVNTDNSVVTNYTYTIDDVQQKCKMSVVTFSQDALIDFANVINMQAENDEVLKGMFPWFSTLQEIATENTDSEISFPNLDETTVITSMKVKTYTDSSKNILGREFEFTVDDLTTEDVECDGSIVVNAVKVKNGSDFAAEYGVELYGQADKVGVVQVTVRGTVDKLDKCSGTITAKYQYNNPDESDTEDYSCTIDFKDYSYLAGLDGYITGTFTLAVNQFNEYYTELLEDIYSDEDDSSVNIDEIRSELSDLTLVLDCSKASDGTQVADLQLLSGTDDVYADLTVILDFNDIEHTVSTPKSYTEYETIEDYTSTIDLNSLIMQLYTALGF